MFLDDYTHTIIVQQCGDCFCSFLFSFFVLLSFLFSFNRSGQPHRTHLRRGPPAERQPALHRPMRPRAAADSAHAVCRRPHPQQLWAEQRRALHAPTSPCRGFQRSERGAPCLIVAAAPLGGQRRPPRGEWACWCPCRFVCAVWAPHLHACKVIEHAARPKEGDGCVLRTPAGVPRARKPRACWVHRCM
jgi:hypothetical protein